MYRCEGVGPTRTAARAPVHPCAHDAWACVYGRVLRASAWAHGRATRVLGARVRALARFSCGLRACGCPVRAHVWEVCWFGSTLVRYLSSSLRHYCPSCVVSAPYIDTERSASIASRIKHLAHLPPAHLRERGYPVPRTAITIR